MSGKFSADNLNGGHRQRLIGRFMSGGFDHMPDYEKLELMLFTAIPRRDVKPMAKLLLLHFGSLPAVLDAEPEELTAIPGIGDHAAFILKLFRAVVPEYLEQQILRREQFNSAAEVADFAKAKLGGSKIEYTMCLYLNSQNRLIDYDILSGTVDRTAVYPRNIAKHALETSAVTVIMAHNHPGGNVCPSEEDLRVTKLVRNALQAVEVTLLDHIIVSQADFISISQMSEL